MCIFSRVNLKVKAMIMTMRKKTVRVFISVQRTMSPKCLELFVLSTGDDKNFFFHFLLHPSLTWSGIFILHTFFDVHAHYAHKLRQRFFIFLLEGDFFRQTHLRTVRHNIIIYKYIILCTKRNLNKESICTDIYI